MPECNGLCSEINMHCPIGYMNEFEVVMHPNWKDRINYLAEKHASAYWGQDEGFHHSYHFGSTRENLLLIFAAYKGEL